MFAYCLNNPVKYPDYVGTRAVFSSRISYKALSDGGGVSSSSTPFQKLMLCLGLLNSN